MLLLLRRRRRAQFRARRPGRTIGVPQPVLAPVEKTLIVSGSRSAPTVELMDAVLRRLAARQSATRENMPHVAAVELIGGGIVLHLSQAQDLPTPWQGSEDQMRWGCSTGVDLDEVGPRELDQSAPYPLLVTICASDVDDVWLLNCEDLAVITITGDPTYGRDFARYLAAELACNPWSREVRVDCVGIAAEISPMNPQRIRYHDGGPDLAAEVLTDAVATIDRVAALRHDVITARAAQLGNDTWPSRRLRPASADSARSSRCPHPRRRRRGRPTQGVFHRDTRLPRNSPARCDPGSARRRVRDHPRTRPHRHQDGAGLVRDQPANRRKAPARRAGVDGGEGCRCRRLPGRRATRRR